MSNSSSTTDFAGRLPLSTIGKTSATGIRPRERAPAVGGTVLGGSGTFLVAGRRAGFFTVFVEASVTRGTLPKASPGRAIPLDQLIGGAVVLQVRILIGLQFRDDLLGELFAQLHTPLVERSDGPDGALGEDAVLVEGDQLTEHVRCELVDQERR